MVDLRKVRIIIFNPEYWSVHLVCLITYVYVFFLGIRLRNFYFFSVTNPAIEFGGIAGERKQGLQDKIPKEFRPNSTLISREMDTETLLATMYSEFDFPVVVKPNQGEQGKAVKIIENQFELETYHQTVSFDYLLQEYIAYSKEYSIMVYTNPTTKEVEIGGITFKEYLSVTGNGKLSLRELIYKNDRAYLQLEQLKKKWGKQWNNIIPNNERFVLNKIGNHNLGTKFLCANHLIDNELKKVIQRIMKPLHKMFLIRFDLKCKSDEDFKVGRDFKILEVNGAGAQPSNMYDPKYTFWQAQAILLKHWSKVFSISKASILEGNKPMTLAEYKAWRKEVRNYRNKISV